MRQRAAHAAPLAVGATRQRARKTLYDRLRRRGAGAVPQVAAEVLAPVAHLHLPPARRPHLRTHRPALHPLACRANRSAPHPRTRRTPAVASTAARLFLQRNVVRGCISRPANRRQVDTHLRRPLSGGLHHPPETPRAVLRFPLQGEASAAAHPARHDRLP